MNLQVGQKVIYDNRIEGYIEELQGGGYFTVAWLDGTTSTEAYSEIPGNSIIIVPKAEDKPLMDYIAAIDKKYPENPEPYGAVRKSPVNNLNDDLFGLLVNKKEDVKYQHYFKDVSKFTHIDVYRVLSLWEVQDPCIQHAIKKLLVAGNRGYKDLEKDIQEAIDSLERWKEMQKETNEK